MIFEPALVDLAPLVFVPVSLFCVLAEVPQADNNKTIVKPISTFALFIRCPPD
ncbi:hypothetical protein D3C76_1780020 [compost metagenome]